MLSNWQRKFPEWFHQHQSLFIQLDAGSQNQLSQLLTLLETKELLDEKTLDCLLKKVYYGLDKLKKNIESLSELTPLSADILLLLLSHCDPESCVKFIGASIAAKGDIEMVKHFLSHHIKMNALSRALALFERSHFDFRQDHLPLFCVLTDILAIPLCQTIFDARCRTDSDYEIPRDPINSSVADAIINKLVALPDEESKVRTFFNFFAEFRPIPASQRYMIDVVDVASLVTMELTADCEAQIRVIQSVEDFVKTQQMIKKLKMKGGDKDVFDRIKYSVANAIVSMDWYSTQRYEQLMEEIWQALSVPQETLSGFTELFEKTQIYLQVAGEALHGHGLFVSSVSMEQSDKNTETAVLDKPLV